eukprot:COSAG03_NODE_1934_length_3337_cov_5.315627_1_plen_85_part_10
MRNRSGFFTVVWSRARSTPSASILLRKLDRVVLTSSKCVRHGRMVWWPVGLVEQYSSIVHGRVLPRSTIQSDRDLLALAAITVEL